MASDAWTLKVEFEGETRRLREWVASGEEPTMEKLRSGVARVFNFSASDFEFLVIRYSDDEGDMCTLTDGTFSDAMCLAIESRLLKVKLHKAAQPQRPQVMESGWPVLEKVRSGASRVQQGVKEHVSTAAEATGLPAPATENLRRLRSNVQDGAVRIQTEVRDGREQLRRSFTEHAQEGEQLRRSLAERVQGGDAWVRQNAEQLDAVVRDAAQHLHHSLSERLGGGACSSGGSSAAPTPSPRAAAAVAVGGLALLASRSVPMVGLAAAAAGVTMAVRAARTQPESEDKQGADTAAEESVAAPAADGAEAQTEAACDEASTEPSDELAGHSVGGGFSAEEVIVLEPNATWDFEAADEVVVCHSAHVDSDPSVDSA